MHKTHRCPQPARSHAHPGRHGLRFMPTALVLALSSALALPGTALASDWVGVTSDWFTAGNWANPGAVPTAADNVFVQSGGTAVVDGGAAATSSLTVGQSGAGTLNIVNGGSIASDFGTIGNFSGITGAVLVDGGNSAWDITNSLLVGGVGTGTLSITSGGTVSNAAAAIGAGAGSSGTATVDGPGSAWTNSSTLSVGEAGNGTLVITGGGVVSNTSGFVGDQTGTSGTVTVNGAGSTWTNSAALTVGSVGTGTLTISNGGKVSDSQGIIGGAAGSTGTVSVDGAGSTWSNSVNLTVAVFGTGTLAVSNGGKVSSSGGVTVGSQAGSLGTMTVSSGGIVNGSNGTIGQVAGAVGHVTVDGANSLWASTAALTVGGAGTGTLAVTNGGAVSNVSGRIGNAVGGSGVVTVDGVNSLWTNTGSLTVGSLGAGSLTISGGGAVTSSTSFIGGAAGVVGSVVVDGAGSHLATSWTVLGDGGSGTLGILNGGTVDSHDVNIGNAAGASGTALVSGAGSTWNSSGNFIIGGAGTGTLTLANGGVVNPNNLFSFTLAGQAGSTGTLNIGGASGAAPTAPGMLSAAVLNFGAGTGIINFNHTDTSGNYDFNSAVSGNGTINQNAGWTTMTGNSSAFTGQANVNGGTLAVNNVLGGTVNVSGTGILGGNGMVGNTMVNAGGTIAPGNSIGTLNVNGNVTFAANSFYQVETNPAGQSDKLLVSGTAIINGGTVQVIGGTGNYNPTTSYSILTATGGVTGTFTGVTSDLAFLDPTLSYAANDVSLTLTRNSTPMGGTGGVGQTPGQSNTGTGVQSAGTGSAVYNAVLGLSAPQARNAFQQLSGEVHASARGVQLQDSHFTRDASLERLRFADSERVGNDGGAGPEESKSGLLPSVRDLAYWARAMGSWGHTDGDGNAATVKRDTSGFLMGADTRFGEEGRFGLMGGYSRSAFDVSDRNSSGSSENYHFGAYAGSRWGDLALRTGISYSRHDVSTSRAVAFPGFTDGLKADYKANTTQGFAELGYRIKTEQAEYEPFVNLANVNVSSDGFTERGGAAALSSSGNSSGVTFSTVGLRASTNFAMDGGTSVTARGSLGWRAASGDITPTTTLAFAGGSSFAVAGAPIAKSAAVVEAGLDFKLTNAATLGLSYGGQFGSGLKDHSARIHLNVAF